MSTNRTEITNEFVIDITKSNDEEKNKNNKQLQLFYILRELYTTENFFRTNMITLCGVFNETKIGSFDPQTQIQIRKLLIPFQLLANMELTGYHELAEFSDSETGKINFNPDYLSFLTQPNNWECFSDASINYEIFLNLINSKNLSKNDKKLFADVSLTLTSFKRGTGIDSYIIQPIQRPPRYDLLLKQAVNAVDDPKLQNIFKNYANTIKEKTNQVQLDLATAKDTKKLFAVLKKGKTKDIKATIESIEKAIAVTLQLNVNKMEDEKKIKQYSYEVFNIAMEQRKNKFNKRTRKLIEIENKLFPLSLVGEEEKQEVKRRVSPTSPTTIPALPQASFLHDHERTLETHHAISHKKPRKSLLSMILPKLKQK